MKLGMQVGLCPGHIVLDVDTAPPPHKGHRPQFSTHIYCGQMADWITMALGMEVSLGRGDFALDGDPPPSPQKDGAHPKKRIFGPCLLRPNGSMDQDGTRHGGRPQRRRLCVRWGPSLPSRKNGQSPIPNFRPISIVAKRLDASRCHLV